MRTEKAGLPQGPVTPDPMSDSTMSPKARESAAADCSELMRVEPATAPASASSAPAASTAVATASTDAAPTSSASALRERRERMPRLRVVRDPAPTLVDALRRHARRIRGKIARRVQRTWIRVRGAWWRLCASRVLSLAPNPLKLCLGSGDAPLEGWFNVDLGGRPDAKLDLRCPLPFDDNSCSHIYSEHLIEHLDYEDAMALLRECRRVLRPDGVLRIATPDLDALVEAYGADWRAQDWVQWPCHSWIDSRARMLNTAFYSWGHRYLFCGDELEARLKELGFDQTERCAIGESRHETMRQLETRLDSRLIYEAWASPEEVAP